MKYSGFMRTSFLIVLSFFFVTGICEAREVTVKIKCGLVKMQLSALRPDGTVIAETKRTGDTGKTRADGEAIRKRRFTLDIPAGEKVMLVISKVKGKFKTRPEWIRLKAKRVIAFWGDEAKTIKTTQFVVSACPGGDGPIDLGTINAFKGKLAISRDPDDNYNAFKQVDTDCDGEADFWDLDDDDDGLNDDVDSDIDGNGVADDDEDMNTDGDLWPDIVDPDDDNDNQTDAEDLDDDGDMILDVDEPDSDHDGVGDNLDLDDDNDGFTNNLDPDDDGDGNEDPPPTEYGCSDNSDCDPGYYCAKEPGDCHGWGECALLPEVCILLVDPVCGCDGVTYSSVCEAAYYGESVAYEGVCSP